MQVAEKVAAGWREEERELEKLRTLTETLARDREGQEERLIFRTMANSIASRRAAYRRVNELISRQFKEIYDSHRGILSTLLALELPHRLTWLEVKVLASTS